MPARAVDFKPVRGESKYQLRQLHCTFKRVTHALVRQDDNDIRHYLLFTKLDVESQNTRELKDERTECPKLDEQLTSLDNIIRSMEMLNDPIPPNNSTSLDGMRLKQDFKHSCVLTQCKECHALWACSYIKEPSAKGEQLAITASKSCQNWLVFNEKSD